MSNITFYETDKVEHTVIITVADNFPVHTFLYDFFPDWAKRVDVYDRVIQYWHVNNKITIAFEENKNADVHFDQFVKELCDFIDKFDGYAEKLNRIAELEKHIREEQMKIERLQTEIF